MHIFLKKMTAVLFLFTFPLFLACGSDGNRPFESSNSSGTYQASLIFPPEIPRTEPDSTSVSKLINGNQIDNSALGSGAVYLY